MFALLACTPPPCERPGVDAWAPAWTEVDVGGAWSSEAGSVSTPCDGCADIVGEATYTFVANRGVLHHLRGVANGATTVRAGDLDTTVDGTFDLTFTPTQDDPLATVVVGTTSLTGFGLTIDDWAEVDTPAPGTLNLGFLIHIEADAAFATDEVKWSRKAAIIAGLADVFAANGAVLTVQADASFVRGAAVWDPAFVDRAGLDWSLHIHPAEDGSDLERVTREGRVALDELGVWATDLNGGFGLGKWSTVAGVGITTVSAFKDAATQTGLPIATTRPWRLAPDASNADVEAFLVEDPEGPVVYLPGSPTSEVDHARFPDHARRVLTQARAHTTDGLYDTWYFVFHVDDFGPSDPDAFDAWLESGALDATLAPYDDLLASLDDPFVGATAMGEAWIAAECP
jgi:hypothetical protein